MVLSKINNDLFNEYVERKLITCRPHPTAPLLIWNYTTMAQVEDGEV